MANNRMFLVHVPTGLAAPLGSRLGWGWSGPKTCASCGLERLFEILRDGSVIYEGSQDDFAVALEDASGASLACGQWEYSETRPDGLLQFVMKK